MKKCSVCLEFKHQDEFEKKGLKPDGSQRFTSRCKFCAKTKQKESYSQDLHGVRTKKRNAVLTKLRELKNYVNVLKSNPCTDCHQSFDPVAMDFDHVNGQEKYMDVSTMCDKGFSKEKILQEIAKCELVCAVCHRIREKNRRLDV